MKNRIVDNCIRMTDEEHHRFKGSGWCFVAFGKVGEIEAVSFLRHIAKKGMVPWNLDDFAQIGFAFKTGDVLRWVAVLDDPENLIDEWVDEWIDKTSQMTERLRNRIF